MEIKYSTLLQWCETNLMILSSISTADNAADNFIKPLTNIVFRTHRDTLLGHRTSTYVAYTIPLIIYSYFLIIN